MITGATCDRQHLFCDYDGLDLLQESLFRISGVYGLGLRAWALFPNHYHAVFLTGEQRNPLSKFMRHFHADSARRLNRIRKCSGRKVWFQFWDTCLTHRNCYYARLRYVMENPVKHGLVAHAKDYPWCSARWFADNVDPAHQRTVMSFGYDRVNVFDDF